MPTYTWTRTREQMRDMVLRKLGVLGIGDTPAAEDSEVVYEAMDARLKELAVFHALWWDVAPAQTDIPLTAGVATATITASDFLLPVTMAVVVGTEQRPVEIADHRRYQAIPDKAETGEPELVFVSGSECRFWPVPRSNMTAKLTYQAIAADTETGASVDVPTAAVRAFVDLIASDLVDDFSLPADKAGRLLAKQKPAMETLRAVAAQKVDTATVQPEWY